jgi:hypothetical protein
MKEREIISTLQELKDEIRQKYKAEVKGISSDVDILVMFFEGATLFDFVGLADYVEEKLNLKVDIVPVDTIREEIKENILREAVYL